MLLELAGIARNSFDLGQLVELDRNLFILYTQEIVFVSKLKKRKEGGLE